MKTKLFMILAVLSMGSMSRTHAQSEVECHLKADLVSNYIWRGFDLGHVSLQPELSVGWQGLSLAAWGSVGLSDKDDPREIDLTLSYETGGLSVGIIDYWNDENGNRYFNYKKGETWHTFEGFVCYDFGPVSASWQTFFAGKDYQEDDGKRAYSSYFELSAPFRLATCDWDATVGLIPWKSYYYETSGFSLTNLSLRATKDIQITNSFSLPLFGQLIANPASQHFYFVFGFTLKAL
ncbi:MAG: hypothetical protein IJP46_08410 [Prevotella sp.]|nr:hypothetical protein [Prevotella sp.]